MLFLRHYTSMVNAFARRSERELNSLPYPIFHFVCADRLDNRVAS